MGKMKRLGAWLLAAALAVQLVPVAGAAVSSDNAKRYLKTTDTSVSGYEDVLNTLSASEKTALFDDLLLALSSIGENGINPATITHDQIFNGLFIMFLNGSFCITDFGTYDESSACYVYSKEEFSRLIQQYFGTPFDCTKYTTTTKPSKETYTEVRAYYHGQFYYCYSREGAGWIYTESVTPQHLYQLGGNRYSASFRFVESQDESIVSDSLRTAVVQKRADGTWGLLRLYPKNYTPTAAELSAFVQPSSWAKAEVEKAQAANLVPALTGAPGWQDNATRLQFAELVVQFVEQATGTTLDAAPSGTFSDTDSAAVRKAYAANIVNGTSATAFSPYHRAARHHAVACDFLCADRNRQDRADG